MFIVISPAKSLNLDPMPVGATWPFITSTRFDSDTAKLIGQLRKLSVKDLEGLMGISTNLAELNHRRYQTFNTPPSLEGQKPAIFTFNGDVYEGLNAQTLNAEALYRAQNKLRILSGLYGLVKPFDLIQPYRLEMGTSLKTSKTSNLYQFWGQKVAKALAEDMTEAQSGLLVNLASEEYAKVLQLKKFDFPVLSVQFLDNKNGKYKVISFNAKRARGAMSRYILEHNASSPEDLQGFDGLGYQFSPDRSDAHQYVFTKDL